MFQPLTTNEHYHSLVLDLDEEDSLSAMTQTLKDKVQESKVILVGFSMGGMIAFDFIRHYPNQVLGLCLLNSNCHADLPGRKAGRDQHLQLAEEEGITELIKQVYLPVYFSEPTQPEAEIVVDMASFLGVDIFRNQLKVLADRPDSLDTLTQFDKPVLIIGAENDVPCPVEHQELMAKSNKHSELNIIKNAGHFAPLEQADQIKQIMTDWVKKHYE